MQTITITFNEAFTLKTHADINKVAQALYDLHFGVNNDAKIYPTLQNNDGEVLATVTIS